MHIIKGFVTIESLIDNASNVTSVIGELSTQSLSYKKDKGVYTQQTTPDYRLTTFTSVDSVALTNIQVGSTQVDQIFRVVDSLLTYNNLAIRPFNSINVINHLTVGFVGEITLFHIGNFVDNGVISVPEWVSWVDDTTGNTIRIWLADAAFRAQYDEYEITVIPPFTDIDHLFTPYASVSTEIGLLQTTDLAIRMEIAKNSHPETYFRILSFKFYNSNDISQSVNVEFGLLIYGKAGDNIDIIKDALQEYILGLSNHPRSEWVVILPDIFKRTEFVIIPRWDKIAIPNLTTLSGLYGSILDVNEAKSFVTSRFNLYPNIWTSNNINIMPFDYKAIMLSVINGPDNVAGSQDIKLMYSDYIPVSTSTIDFNRMSINTKEWLLLLETALIEAETADGFSSLVEPLRKITRNNVLYITFLYNNVNYLVAARGSTLYS